MRGLKHREFPQTKRASNSGKPQWLRKALSRLASLKISIPSSGILVLRLAAESSKMDQASLCRPIFSNAVLSFFDLNTHEICGWEPTPGSPGVQRLHFAVRIHELPGFGCHCHHCSFEPTQSPPLAQCRMTNLHRLGPTIAYPVSRARSKAGRAAPGKAQ